MKMKISTTIAAILTASTIAFNVNAKLGPMAGGSTHGLYIERGAVFAFGNNTTAACGPNASSNQQLDPVYVGLNNVKGVTAVGNWSVAQKTDNIVWYWGVC